MNTLTSSIKQSDINEMIKKNIVLLKQQIFSLLQEVTQLKSIVAFTPEWITVNEVAIKNDISKQQHNGKSSKRLIEQLYVHLIAISEGTACKKHNFERSNRVAVVFELESTKHAVIKRLQKIEAFKPFYNFFIFKTNGELKNDFFNGWTLISGEKVNFI